MTATISTEDFVEIRKTTIGAHETPALFETVAEIAGVDSNDYDEHTDEQGEPINAYGSPLSLWELKTGKYTPKSPEKRSLWSRVKWGVCHDAVEELGLQSRKPEGVSISTRNPHMSSRVEMEVSEQGETWYPMIAKNVASNKANMWRNSIGDAIVPEAVQLEAQHHMAVRGVDKCYIVVFLGGLTTQTHIIERDDELCEELIETIEEFWHLIENNQRPRTNAKRDQEIITRLNATIDPTVDVKDFRDDSEFLTLLAEKDKLKAVEKETKNALKDIEAQIKEKMDGVGAAIISDTHQIKWIKTAEAPVNYIKPAGAYLRTSKINPKAAGSTLEDLIERSS